MKKLLYILPVVLIMGFATHIERESNNEPKEIVFNFDDDGLMINDQYLLKTWSHSKLEHYLGKPNRFVHNEQKFLNYSIYDDLGIYLMVQTSANHEPKSIIICVNGGEELEGFQPKNQFDGKIMLFGEEISLDISMVDFEKRYNDIIRRVDVNNNKLVARITKNGHSIDFNFKDNKLSTIFCML